MILNPAAKRFSICCFIISWNIQISILLRIDCRKCIPLFPSDVKYLPRHPQLIQLSDALFRQLSIVSAFPRIVDPLSQRIVIFRFVFRRDLQISKLLPKFSCFLQTTLPCGIVAISPLHANAVQPCDLLFGQVPRNLSRTNTALGRQPFAKAQSRWCGITFWNIQVVMLRIVNACFRKIMIPTGRKACLQLLKQYPAVMHLLNNLESLGNDLIALAVSIEPVDRLLHLAL